jgi:tetratricopeptide (TPR) repeat protein
MKRFILTGLLLATASGPQAWAVEGPDDQYVRIYNLLLQADDLNRSGQKREAYEMYQSVQAGLKTISVTYPDFNQKVLQFRLNYVADKLSQFGPQPAALPATNTLTTTTVNTLVEKVEKSTPAAPLQDDSKVKSLTDEVQRLNSEKTVLEAKLREALSAQPATVDPREVAKAEEKIRGLQKENELLKISLDQEKTKVAKKLDASEAEAAKKSLAEANRTLEEQKQTIAALKQEKELLQTRLRGAESKPAPVTIATDSKAATETLQKQVESLQAQLKVAQKANSAEAIAEKKAAKNETKQIKRLQEERDELAKKLAESEQALKKSKDKKAAKTGVDTGADALQAQVRSLQSRLDVLEAKKVPYTAEELALFSAPAPVLTAAASTDTAKAPPAKPVEGKKAKVSKEEPAGSAAEIAEARKAYNEGHFDAAEKAYQRVLLLDENNISTLGNLAVTQMQQDHLDAAEKTLKKALELESEDTFNLNLMGKLKFLQNKFDEALDTLSKAARLDPKNPETQNYLGITLSQKGQREAAEVALRKAIQLAPDYASAHVNLAVIYATQNPPYIALANYHYSKGLANGHPRNAELDKILGKK